MYGVVPHVVWRALHVLHAVLRVPTALRVPHVILRVSYGAASTLSRTSPAAAFPPPRAPRPQALPSPSRRCRPRHPRTATDLLCRVLRLRAIPATPYEVLLLPYAPRQQPSERQRPQHACLTRAAPPRRYWWDLFAAWHAALRTARRCTPGPATRCAPCDALPAGGLRDSAVRHA
jgi:hypothetical protein